MVSYRGWKKLNYPGGFMLRTDAEEIERQLQILDKTGTDHRKLREEAIAEGYKDERCPGEGCGRLYLAHAHFVYCELQGECPMVSKSLRQEDGTPKTMLDLMVEGQPA